jgi:predicted MPP superfamily phosphohydrolase
MSAGAVASLAPISLGSYSTGCLTLEKAELRLPKWDADGFRVALLADLHTNTPAEVMYAINAVKLAIEQKPDLIAIPGDFVNVSEPRHLGFVRQALEPFNDAPCPVIATLGNHDYDCRNINGIVSTIRSTKVVLLQNKAVEVNGVTVAGIDDAIAHKHQTEFLADGSFSKSLLALLHEPDFVDVMPTNVSLQLSGHSHGGQICLPGGRPLHTPYGAWNYFAGYYPNAKVPLYVTRGVGTVGPRIRLFCLPEVNILTLRGA